MTLAETIRFPAILTGVRRYGAGWRWISPLLLLALWELGSRTGVIPPNVLAAPSAMAGTFWGLVQSGELASNQIVSCFRVAAGLAIGFVLASALTLSADVSRLGEDVADPPIQMLRTLPVLALSPLFIVGFGIDETPKVALIVTHDVDEAISLADRVPVLDGGRIAAEERIDLPRPRDGGAGFQGIRRRLLGHLGVEVSAPAPRAAPDYPLVSFPVRDTAP